MPVQAEAPALRAEAGLARCRGLILPLALVASVLVVLVPLPTPVLDFLLAINLTLAVLVLLTTVSVRSPMEFSVFPSVLLGTTLLRLVLNVAATRLILTRGADYGTLAAGGVIQGFGEFVAGDKLAVGFVMFLILVVIQFVVITKGATRISEVAARFALDGLPGRQLAIDADLNAGNIDQPEARRRRDELGRQTDFYAAMDGASKFVRGDAVAGLAIIALNIVGGLYVGVIESGLTLEEAVGVFTKLTIGDALVTQLPAFLTAVAAGLIVTRSTHESDLPRDLLRQLFSSVEALAVAAGFVTLLAFTRLPRLPLVVLGLSCAAAAWWRWQARLGDQEAKQRPQPGPEPLQPPQEAEKLRKMYLLQLEIGWGLVRLTDKQQGGDLAERMQRLRQEMARELGLILPPVRICDNLRLKPRQYVVKVRDAVVAEGLLESEPWKIDREGASASRAPLEGSLAALMKHLAETIRQHADALLAREDVKELLDGLKATAPSLVGEVVPGLLSVGEVREVLANLLRERVPIRDLETILEALSQAARRVKDPDRLTEYARRGLARAICQQYRHADKTLHVVTLAPALESQIAGGSRHQGEEREPSLSASPQDEYSGALWLAPEWVERLNERLGMHLAKLTVAGRPAVVLCRPEVRPVLKRLTAGALPHLAVLSFSEVTPDTRVVRVSEVKLEELGDAVVNDSRQEAGGGRKKAGWHVPSKTGAASRVGRGSS